MKRYPLNVILTVFFLLCWVGCESGLEPTGPGDTGMEKISDLQLQSIRDDVSDINTATTLTHGQGIPGQYSEALIVHETGGLLNFRNGSLEVLPFSIDETKVIAAHTYSLQKGDFFKKVFEFEPSGTTFDPPAILTLNYCDLGPIVPETILLRVYNEDTGQWEIASHMTNDSEARTYTGAIRHFSRYSLSGNGQVLRPQTP